MNKLLKPKSIKSYLDLLPKISMVMRVTVVLLFCILFQAHAEKLYSQSAKISLNLQNATVEKILNTIEENSEFSFLYNSKLINIDRKASVNATEKTISAVLNELFDNSDVQYKVENKQIVLSKKELNVAKTQQTKKITGLVKDLMGLTVIGASITVKGTTEGTITDMDGKFTLNVSPDAIIEISYVGYVTQTIHVNGKEIFTIELREDTQKLDELIVVGYGTQKKESLTSAITSVDTELLANRSIMKVATALQGMTPGVNIRQTTGRPGYSASTFDIRGASMGTFSDNPPLVLIDGIVDNIDNVNPENIDQISILKDAAAAAIYGSRATGGVVLITTKKGLEGKAQVSYSGTVGFQELPINDYKFINSAEWMRANNEAKRLDGGTGVIYSPEQIAKYTDSTDPMYPAESQWADWYKEKSMQQNHTVSLRAGSDKLKFYASAGLVKQDGLIENDNYTKMNVLMNVDYSPIKRLDITTSLSYQREDTERPSMDVFTAMRNALLNPPTDPFYLSNGEYNNAATLGANPAYLVSESGNQLYEYNRLRMAVSAKYQIFDGLSVKYTGSTSMGYDLNNSLYKKIPFINDQGEIFGYNRSDVRVSESWSRSNYYNNLIMMEYVKEIKDHDIHVMAGFQSEENRYDEISASANKFPTNEIREVSGTSGSGNDIKGSSNATDWAIASVIAKLNYSFKDKYIFEGTIRNDGSSRFSPDQRWGLFPALSASWRIREESFMQSIDCLSNLKLRLSWGELGNQGGALYPFSTQISLSDKYPFGNSLSAIGSIGSPVNLALSWEAKTTTNIGLDFGFLGNRLTGSADYFMDRTDGIIARPVVSSIFGAEAPIQNSYIIDNKGFEIDLKWTDNIGDFRYFVGVNISDSRDEIVSLGGAGSLDPDFGTGLVQKSGSTFNAEGKPRNSLHIYRTNGLFVNQEEIDNSAFISNLTRPGDIAFVDTNGDGKLTPDDKVADDRTTTPHYFYGINLGGSYKNVDFMAVFNGVGERWGYRNNGGTYLTGVRASLSILEGNYENRWTEANPDKFADQPRLTQNNWIANEYSTLFTGPSEFHLRNYGYLRLKNVQIGYTFPTEWMKKASISKLRIYATIENLFTITPGYEEPLDPESVEGHSDDGSAFFGVPRVMSLGLQLNF